MKKSGKFITSIQHVNYNKSSGSKSVNIQHFSSDLRVNRAMKPMTASLGRHTDKSGIYLARPYTLLFAVHILEHVRLVKYACSVSSLLRNFLDVRLSHT